MVNLLGLEDDVVSQPDLFAETAADEGKQALMRCFDSINRRYGQNAIRTALNITGNRSWSMRRRFLSPAYPPTSPASGRLLGFVPVLYRYLGIRLSRLARILYPQELPREQFLACYADQFNALELNYTYYGMPEAKHMDAMIKRSGSRLHFSVKAHRSLTHDISLSKWRDEAARFCEAMRPLQERKLLLSVLFSS